jgi:diguanylate cyclase (GGDEF)-like protein/PAS domain S-box-containing protein
MGFLQLHPVVLPAVTLVSFIAVIALAFMAIRRNAALRAAERSVSSFRDLYDNISEGVFRSTLDGRMISANPALVRLNGFDSEAEMLAEVNDIAGKWYVDPARRAEIHAMLEKHGKVTNIRSEVYRYKTRERIWIEESVRLVRNPRTGRAEYYDGTLREVTDSVRRLQLQERYDRIAEVVSGCLYQAVVQPDGRVRFPYASPGMTQIFGVRPEELLEDGSIISALVHADDIGRLRQSFADAAREMRPRQDEYRIRTLDGVEKWVYGHAVPEPQPDGSIAWYGYFVDVTDRKRSEAHIYDLAFRDTLTGLPNRAALVSALTNVGEAQRWSALLFIDLDQFKVLNDTKGHHFGDRLLCGVAERLKPVVSPNDMVARLGGDEFVILVHDVGRNESAADSHVRRLADRIHAAIADPFVLDRFPFHASASVGAALFRGGEVAADDLLKRADMAMYAAKASGRGVTSVFVPEMQKNLEEQLALTMELRDALEGGRQLSLVYQPQVDDAGSCFGVEALLRWDHPVRGQIPPSVFVPLAQSAGLGRQIDAYVLAAACATLRRWRENPALSNLRMSVNIGNRKLDASLAALVTNAIRATGADAPLLMIEITEHVMMDNIAEVDATLLALKRLGVKIALDDFGTGYSSLSHLKRLPIDALKIDRSFVDELETDANDRVIVQTILNIARNLGVAAIAEGVENEMQALLLRRFGCHAYQGYLFGRPMGLPEFEARISALGGSSETLRPASKLVV